MFDIDIYTMLMDMMKRLITISDEDKSKELKRGLKKMARQFLALEDDKSVKNMIKVFIATLPEVTIIEDKEEREKYLEEFETKMKEAYKKGLRHRT